MCNRYELAARQWEEWCNLTGRDPDWRTNWPPPGWDGRNKPFPELMFPKSEGVFLRSSAEGGLEGVAGRWGLVGPGHRGPLKDADRFPCNNARSEGKTGEGMHNVFPFKFVIGNRALIPISRFQEWTGPKGTKTMHNFSAVPGGALDVGAGLLFAAALWSQSNTADGPVTSYTMVMQATREGDDCQPFHDRQPVLLGLADAKVWLDANTPYMAAVGSPPCGSLLIDPPQPVAA